MMEHLALSRAHTTKKWIWCAKKCLYPEFNNQKMQKLIRALYRAMVQTTAMKVESATQICDMIMSQLFKSLTWENALDLKGMIP